MNGRVEQNTVLRQGTDARLPARLRCYVIAVLAGRSAGERKDFALWNPICNSVRRQFRRAGDRRSNPQRRVTADSPAFYLGSIFSKISAPKL